VYKAYDLVELRTVALKIHELNSQWSEEKKVFYAPFFCSVLFLFAAEGKLHAARHPRKFNSKNARPLPRRPTVCAFCMFV
jgi:hypothetical protein